MSATPVAPKATRLADPAALLRITRRLHAASVPPWLHAEVGRRMAERLPIIRLHPERVLDWWSFMGASVDTLRQAYPKAELLVLEPDGMAHRPVPASARPAVPWWSPHRWLGAAPRPVSPQTLPPGAADLVWANMGLHFWHDPQEAFNLWHRALAVDSFLMFSTLGPGSLGGLQTAYTAAGWPSPFAPFVDMHDLGDMLIEAGFADPVMDQEQVTLTWPTAQAAVAELRLWGGNAHPRREQGLRTPRWQQRLLQTLAASAGPDGRIALTFEVVYGHAFKPLPRPRVAPTTQVPLEDLRMMAKSRPSRR